MNLLICSESHYVQVGTEIYCPQTPPDYFQRYREVWDKVVLLGRMAICSQAPSGAPLLNLEGIEVVGLPDYRGPFQYGLHRRRIRKIACDTLARVDGILFRGAHQISGVVYSLIHREGRPYGVEVVGDPYDSMAPGATSHPLRAFFRWKFVQNQKRICRDAFASAYVTSAALQRRYPPSPGKFTTSFSDVVIKPVNVAREQFPSQGPYRLIAIGTLATMYKGYDVLLHAVAKAIGAGLKLQLVIIGDGQHLPSMKQLAQALGIGDRVNFRGLVPFGDPIFAELDGAHLFVMPSRQEGLPRAMVEAMARALPCIGTSVGGIPELLEPTELIPPNDVPALSAKLVEVLTDPQRMMKLSKRNLEVAGNFTENVLRSRRLEFYQYLLAGTETWRLHSPPL